MTEKSAGCRPVPVAIGAVTLTLVTAMASFLIASSMFPKPNCEMPKLNFPKDAPEWHEVDRMEIPDKNLIISRPVGANRCYVLPKRSPTDDDAPRPLVIINDKLSFQMLEHLAGSDAAAFCNGYDAYLARELNNEEAAATRKRRQAGYGGGPPPVPAGGYSQPPAPPPGGYSAPPAPPPAPQPGGYSEPAPPPQPAGGYSAPPAPQPSGGYSAPPAPQPAGGYSAPPAPQPSGGYSGQQPAPQPSGGYSAPPPQPANQPGGYGGAAPYAASGAGGPGGAANAGGVAVGAGQSAAAALSPLTGSAWTGQGIFGTAKDTGKQALQLGIDERTPRCSEILLDCVDHMGQVQSCYTWVNGVLWMDRKCTDSKQFVIRMTKPPGRILKIAQQQWIECLKRRNEGKTC